MSSHRIVSLGLYGAPRASFLDRTARTSQITFPVLSVPDLGLGQEKTGDDQYACRRLAVPRNCVANSSERNGPIGE